MRKKDLYAHVLAFLESTMDSTETELHYSNPFELLVAVVLSAQCTDKRINMVTPRLFADYPTPEAMAAATPETIFSYISSVSYPNNKAKHLVGLARKLCSDFQGEVPSTLEELTRLPGVGRKTANVIQAVAFGKAALAVDTHVFRVSHRLGLVPARCTTPYSVEMELRKHIPEDKVAASHYWLLLHGRYTCTARSPKCAKCGLQEVCAYLKRDKRSSGL
ncbi:endonuclease III [bacterium]|nr:endonuclease III [bacterium]